MLRQIRNRLFSLLIILFGLSLLTFGLTFLLPSGPVEQVVAKMGITPDPVSPTKAECEAYWRGK